MSKELVKLYSGIQIYIRTPVGQQDLCKNLGYRALQQLLGTYHGFFYIFIQLLYICDALRDLVPFLQFKKCGKHPWRSVTFTKVAGFY